VINLGLTRNGVAQVLPRLPPSLIKIRNEKYTLTIPSKEIPSQQA
jgi:hypothetical protein